MVNRKRVMITTSVSTAAIIAGRLLVVVGHTQTPALPAPLADRVGFPAGYKDTYKLFYVFDNFQNRQIRAVYGNPTAASVAPGQAFNFPYGSIILFESYSVQEDASGEPKLDANGRFVPNTLTTLFVMRKERGFGEAYNGSLSLSPSSQRVGAQWDYVFRPDLYFGRGSGAVPKGVLQNYVFVPSTIHAQPGETITIYNSDQLLHRIVSDDGTIDTGIMVPGSTFAVRAGNSGISAFHCALHSRMKGQIVVDPPPALGPPARPPLAPLSVPTGTIGPIFPPKRPGTSR